MKKLIPLLIIFFIGAVFLRLNKPIHLTDEPIHYEEKWENYAIGDRPVIEELRIKNLDYISIPLIDKYNAGNIGWKQVDENCKTDCVMTLEMDELIDQMNKYNSENTFKAEGGDFIKQLLKEMKKDKLSIQAYVR